MADSDPTLQKQQKMPPLVIQVGNLLPPQKQSLSQPTPIINVSPESLLPPQQHSNPLPSVNVNFGPGPPTLPKPMPVIQVSPATEPIRLQQQSQGQSLTITTTPLYAANQPSPQKHVTIVSPGLPVQPPQAQQLTRKPSLKKQSSKQQRFTIDDVCNNFEQESLNKSIERSLAQDNMSLQKEQLQRIIALEETVRIQEAQIKLLTERLNRLEKQPSFRKNTMSNRTIPELDSQLSDPGLLLRHLSDIQFNVHDAIMNLRKNNSALVVSQLFHRLSDPTIQVDSLPTTEISPTSGGNELAQSVPDGDSSQSDDDLTEERDGSELRRKEVAIDLAFMNADVLVKYDEKFKKVFSANPQQQLQADIMYNQIVEVFDTQEKQYHLMRRHLDLRNLTQVLSKQPKVLILNCHGGQEQGSTETYLSFEHSDKYTMRHVINEKELVKILEVWKNTNVHLVIISACHSSKIGQLFHTVGKVPVVISINSDVKVYEKAAESFNQNLLSFLLQGQSPRQAFNFSKQLIQAQCETSAGCCCDHEHDLDCFWLKLKDKHELNALEAHLLHVPSCKCHQIESSLGNLEHRGECASFRAFYNKLTKSGNPKILDLLEQKLKSDPNFLKVLNPHGTNIMCCCRQHLPHNESDKFVIIGSEKWNEPIYSIQEERVKGPVTQDTLLDQKGWPFELRRQSNWLFDRNIEIHHIVQFLIHRQRLLTVYGSPMIGKSAIICQAIKIVLARSKSKFKDGIFFVDLENGAQPFIRKLSDALQTANPDPSEEQIINDLTDKSCLIVIKDCQYLTKPRNQITLLKQIRSLIQTTRESTKFLVIMQENMHKQQYDFDSEITIGPMSKDGLILLFIHMIKIQKKEDRLPPLQQVWNHQLFDVVDPNYLKKVVHQFEGAETLDQVYNEIAPNLQSANSSNSSHGGGKRSKQQREKRNQENGKRTHAFLVKQLLRSATYKLEVNLIYFLTLMPAGLSITEIKQLTGIYKKWFGTQHVIIENLESGRQIEELNQSLNENRQDTTFLDLYDILPNSELNDLAIVRTYRNHTNILSELLVSADLWLKDNTTRQMVDLLSICIEFNGTQARSILRSVKKQQRSQVIDHTLVMAHLDCGMWGRPFDEEYFTQDIDRAEQRFTAYQLTNFKHMLNFDLLSDCFPALWSDTLTNEQEYIFDMCLTVPSILVQLNRLDEAIELIKQCKRFGGQEKPLLLHGYLDLMLASIYTNYNLETTGTTERLLKNARETFLLFHVDVTQTDDLQMDRGFIEGRAESFFIEALLRMREYKQSISAHVVTNLNRKNSLELKHSLSTVNDDGDKPFQHGFQRKSNHDDIKKKPIEILQQVVESLRNAENCFNLLEEIPEESGAVIVDNRDFGRAKTILAEAEFFISWYDSFSDHEKRKIHFDREAQMDRLIAAEQLFNKRRSSDQNSLTNYNANYEAQTICMQAKLQMMTTYGEDLTHEQILDARTIIDKADELRPWICENILSKVNNIKNEILKFMRSYYHNLFTFAKAWPIVQKRDDGQIMDGPEYTTSKFELKPAIEREFNEAGIEIQIKFDFLNSDLLRSAIEQGTRVLHISSDIYDSETLFIEGELGLCQKIHISDIKSYFRSYQKSGLHAAKTSLPVSCVVLAIPNSTKIGELFSDMGVDHVVTFDFEREGAVQQDDQTESSLMKYRYNYIYAFCQQFYISLCRQLSVLDSFKSAQEEVKQPETLDAKIWDHLDVRDIENYDLRIRPRLIHDYKKIHQRKLFDLTAAITEPSYAKRGRLYDISLARPQLIGIGKFKKDYIGLKTTRHQVLKILTDTSGQAKVLCHITGAKGVGKTTFLQEIAYFLHSRRLFTVKVQYENMQKIKTEQEFKDFLKAIEHDDLSQNSKEQLQMLLIFDNIDQLPVNISKRFESRLIDKLRKIEGIRFLTSSTKKFKFEQFDTDLKSKNPRKMCHVKLPLLDDLEAADLVISSCMRPLTGKVLDMGIYSTNDIRTQLSLEEKLKVCKGLPVNLLELARLLEDYNLIDINYIKSDRHKNEKTGKPGHNQAKQKKSHLFVVDQNASKINSDQQSQSFLLVQGLSQNAFASLISPNQSMYMDEWQRSRSNTLDQFEQHCERDCAPIAPARHQSVFANPQLINALKASVQQVPNENESPDPIPYEDLSPDDWYECPDEGEGVTNFHHQVGNQLHDVSFSSRRQRRESSASYTGDESIIYRKFATHKGGKRGPVTRIKPGQSKAGGGSKHKSSHPGEKSGKQFNKYSKKTKNKLREHQMHIQPIKPTIEEVPETASQEGIDEASSTSPVESQKSSTSTNLTTQTELLKRSSQSSSNKKPKKQRSGGKRDFETELKINPSVLKEVKGTSVDGLSVVGKHPKKPKCKYGGELQLPLGQSEDLESVKLMAKCPLCHKALTVDRVQFYNCFYTIAGIRNGAEVREDSRTMPNQNLALDLKESWKQLTVTIQLMGETIEEMKF